MLRTVVVNLIAPADEAVQGVLFSTRGPFYVLKEAIGMKIGSAPAPLPGDVIIDRQNVSYIVEVTS